LFLIQQEGGKMSIGLSIILLISIFSAIGFLLAWHRWNIFHLYSKNHQVVSKVFENGYGVETEQCLITFWPIKKSRLNKLLFPRPTGSRQRMVDISGNSSLNIQNLSQAVYCIIVGLAFPVLLCVNALGIIPALLARLITTAIERNKNCNLI